MKDILRIKEEPQFHTRDLEDDFTGMSQELRALFLKDELNRVSGNVSADTIGADYFFMKGFLSREMSLDFPWIEKDFFKHCYHKLDDFEVQTWYGGERFADSNPEEAIQTRILTYIFNGAKSQDSYCVELIKYLYKTYHKREYKQLKRFRRISVSEIFSLAEYEDGGVDYLSMGRLLGMCCIYGIEMEERCSFLYLLLEKKRIEWLEETEYAYDNFDQNLFDECMEQVDAWIAEYENGKAYRKQFRAYWEADKFVEKYLEDSGYPGDYVISCLDNFQGIRFQLVRALRILKTIYPNREFTYEEVQRYAQLYTVASGVVHISETCEYEIQNALGYTIECFDEEDASLFKPENIIVKEKPVAKASEMMKPVSKVSTVSGEANIAEYLTEITKLRRKLNQQEKDNRYLQEQYRNLKAANQEYEKMLQKYEDEREELITLREFAYNLEHEETSFDTETIEDMKVIIADKKIAIVGGHINWIKKLKSLFPSWLYIHEDVSQSFDSNALDSVEKLYFFTDHLSHKNYGKFIAIVRERRIAFGYLAYLNIEKLISQVYEDFK